MDDSRRQVLLGTLAVVGVAGCLDSDAADEPEDVGSTAADGTDETPDATPATDESTPSPTPDDDQQSPSGDDPTPSDDESTPSSSDEDGPTPTPEDDDVFPGYEMTDIAVQSPDGDSLGWVRAAIADTPDLRRTGLSDTGSLPESYGMLFVYEEVGERTFIMPDMDFGIDIVFADDDGTVTTIHHAPKPGPDEDGSEQRYEGRGQYVLEVNKNWTTERGVEEGDVLAFDMPD